jgi:hypothetical protein
MYKRRTRRGAPPPPELIVSTPPSPIASPAPEPAEIEPPILELGLRRPTLWAAALLAIGIMFGAAIARAVVTRSSPPVACAATRAARNVVEASVAWPRATRFEAAPPAPVDPANTEAPNTLALTALASSAPPLAGRPPHHHRAQVAEEAADNLASPPEAPAPSASAPTEAEDAENAAATIARAREALTDAL